MRSEKQAISRQRVLKKNHSYFSIRIGNMCAPKDIPLAHIPSLQDVQARLENIVTTEEPTVTRKKRERQNMYNLQARIRNRKQVILCLSNHLKKGTFPKRFKSLRPYPTMGTPESQTLVNTACQRVESVILEQMIREEKLKLNQDQTRYECMKKERQRERTQVPRKPKTMSIVELQQELKELQLKYGELCRKVENKE